MMPRGTSLFAFFPFVVCHEVFNHQCAHQITFVRIELFHSCRETTINVASSSFPVRFCSVSSRKPAFRIGSSSFILKVFMVFNLRSLGYKFGERDSVQGSSTSAFMENPPPLPWRRDACPPEHSRSNLPPGISFSEDIGAACAFTKTGEGRDRTEKKERAKKSGRKQQRISRS